MKQRPHWVVLLPFLLPLIVFSVVAFVLWRVQAIDTLQDQAFVVSYFPLFALGGGLLAFFSVILALKMVFRKTGLTEAENEDNLREI